MDKKPYDNKLGNALVFFSSMILRISKKDTITEGEDAVGNEIQIAFKKNKLGTPYKVVTTKLIFGKTISLSTIILPINQTKIINNIPKE